MYFGGRTIHKIPKIHENYRSNIMETTDLILRTCPFCGGSATLRSQYSAKYHGYFVFVKCDICRSQGTIFLAYEDPFENDWEDVVCTKAISAWNRRNGEKEKREVERVFGSIS